MNLSKELGQTALVISHWSHAVALAGVIGSVAASIAGAQPVLKAAFGDQKGALITVVAIGISAACAQLLAHSSAIGATGEPITTVSQSTTVNSPKESP